MANIVPGAAVLVAVGLLLTDIYPLAHDRALRTRLRRLLRRSRSTDALHPARRRSARSLPAGSCSVIAAGTGAVVWLEIVRLSRCWFGHRPAGELTAWVAKTSAVWHADRATRSAKSAGESFVDSTAFEALSRAGLRCAQPRCTRSLRGAGAASRARRRRQDHEPAGRVSHPWRHQRFGGDRRLALVAAGLGGYSLWRLVRAALGRGP